MLRSHGCTVEKLNLKIDFHNIWASSIPAVTPDTFNATIEVSNPSAPTPSGLTSVNIIRHPLSDRNPSEHSSQDENDKYPSIQLEDAVFNMVVGESVGGNVGKLLLKSSLFLCAHKC